MKVSSLLVAKNHFVFYFFVILKKRKWFLLGAVLIEILGVKAPPSQSRFPLAVSVANRKKPTDKSTNTKIKIVNCDNKRTEKIDGEIFK